MQHTVQARVCTMQLGCRHLTGRKDGNFRQAVLNLESLKNHTVKPEAKSGLTYPHQSAHTEKDAKMLFSTESHLSAVSSLN
jgi:hypothetical protein